MSRTPASQRVVTQDDLPGFQMTLPAGVTVTGWDGQLNTQVAIRQVPADRAPLPPFPADRYSPTLYMYSFGKQGGGTPCPCRKFHPACNSLHLG